MEEPASGYRRTQTRVVAQKVRFDFGANAVKLQQSIARCDDSARHLGRLTFVGATRGRAVTDGAAISNIGYVSSTSICEFVAITTERKTTGNGGELEQ